MSIPIPKILPALTLDAALTLQLYITNAAPFDTGVECTINAGTYFMRWDGQSDDFLRELHRATYAALDACAVAGYNGSDYLGKPVFSINSAHKVVIGSNDPFDIRFKWSEDDGATIAGILGFDATVDTDVAENDPQTANWQHAYGWYGSDEGQLASDSVEDRESAHIAQARALGGEVATKYLSSVYDNHLLLKWLGVLDTFSNGVGYTTAPTDPYERNRGLECLWRAIRDGTRFCIYRDSIIDTAKAEELGTTDIAVGTPTTIEVTGKAWGTTPQEHAGKLVLVEDWDPQNNDMRFYISSHDANTITVPNAIHNTDAGGAVGNQSAYIFDQRYRTYVLDLLNMRSFVPVETPGIDKYEVDIPLLRYVA